MNIPRPTYYTTPLADALRWRGDCGFLFTEKMDGRFAVRSMAGSVLVGEDMPGGEFFAFDLVNVSGEDVRQRSLRERWAALLELRALGVQVVPSGSGGEYVEAVLRSGGEGVVAANLDAPYGLPGARFKAKRVETFDCRVVEKASGKNSVRLEYEGQDAGWVSSMWHWDYELAIGSVVEIAAFGRHRSGKFREARILRTRPDKREFAT